MTPPARTTASTNKARKARGSNRTIRSKRKARDNFDGDENAVPRSSAAEGVDDTNANDIIWDEMFEELRTIKEKTGTCNLPDKKGRLAKWVYAQRKAFRRLQYSKGTPSTRERLAKLESIGFEFASSSYVSWDDMFEIYKNNDVDTAEEARKLKLWMSNQRLEYSRKRRGLPNNITQERIAKLNSVGFQWVGRTGKPTGLANVVNEQNKRRRPKKAPRRRKRMEKDFLNRSREAQAGTSVTTAMADGNCNGEAGSMSISTNEGNEDSKYKSTPDASSERNHQQLEEVGSFLQAVAAMRQGVPRMQSSNNRNVLAPQGDESCKWSLPTSMSLTEEDDSNVQAEDNEEVESGIPPDEDSKTNDEMESEGSLPHSDEKNPHFDHGSGCGEISSSSSSPSEGNELQGESSYALKRPTVGFSVDQPSLGYGNISVTGRPANHVISSPERFRVDNVQPLATTVGMSPFVAPPASTNAYNTNTNIRDWSSVVDNSVSMAQSISGDSMRTGLSNALLFQQQLPTSIETSTMPSINTAMFNPSYLTAVAIQQHLRQLWMGQPQGLFSLLPTLGGHGELPTQTSLINQFALLSTLSRGRVAEDEGEDFPPIDHFLHPR